MSNKDVKMFCKQAMTFLEKGEFEKSLKLLDMVINIDNKFIPAWNCKGVAHLEMEEYSQALNSFEQVIELNAGDNLAWYNKGYVLLLMEEYTESKKVFDFFLARYPKKDDDFYRYALYLRAKSYYGLKEYENALESVEKAIERDKNFREALELRNSIKSDMDKEK